MQKTSNSQSIYLYLKLSERRGEGTKAIEECALLLLNKPFLLFFAGVFPFEELFCALHRTTRNKEAHILRHWHVDSMSISN